MKLGFHLKDDQSGYLGSELDLVYSKTMAKTVKLNTGYSQFFETESMVDIKGATQPAKTQTGAGSN